MRDSVKDKREWYDKLPKKGWNYVSSYKYPNINSACDLCNTWMKKEVYLSHPQIKEHIRVGSDCFETLTSISITSLESFINHPKWKRHSEKYFLHYKKKYFIHIYILGDQFSLTIDDVIGTKPYKTLNEAKFTAFKYIMHKLECKR